jgi:hypothetical protein
MPSLIDIRRRIRSVKNTQQITKAMKMVSAAKLRRAQDRVIAARPYGSMLRNAGQCGAAVAGRRRRRQESAAGAAARKRILLVLVTSDKGLAGAFNTNLIKAAQRFIAEHPDASVTLVLIGRKGRDFFRKRGAKVVSDHINMAGKLVYADVAAIAGKVMEPLSQRRDRRGLPDLQRIQERGWRRTLSVPARSAHRAARADEPAGLHLRAIAGRDAPCAVAALRGRRNFTARCWNRPRPNMPPA